MELDPCKFVTTSAIINNKKQAFMHIYVERLVDCTATGLEKERVEAFAHRVGHKGEDIEYEAEFQVGREFGEIEAVCVENEHHEEMYVDEILIHGFPKDPVKVKCASWVHSKYEDPHSRVFFTNKVCSFLTFVLSFFFIYLSSSLNLIIFLKSQSTNFFINIKHIICFFVEKKKTYI